MIDECSAAMILVWFTVTKLALRVRIHCVVSVTACCFQIDPNFLNMLYVYSTITKQVEIILNGMDIKKNKKYGRLVFKYRSISNLSNLVFSY